MQQNQLHEAEIYDLETLRFQPGRLNLPVAGKFLGDKTPQATYKAIERGNFPVTLTPRPSGGFWVLKAHLKKYLEDGIPQPQTFERQAQPAPPVGEKRGRGRPSHKSKAARAAVKTGGV